MEGRKFRNAMGKFATGVNVIATKADGKIHAMTANAFMSVSLDPKLVIISIGENASMLNKIKKSKKFSINILSEKQQKESMIFAGQIESEEVISFDELAGVPVLSETLAQVSCAVENEYVEGDHTLFVGRVLAIELNEGEPLIFSSGKYRQLAQEKVETSV